LSDLASSFVLGRSVDYRGTFSFDEAFNLLDIVNMQNTGSFPIYFPANNGREPLFLYLQALSAAVFGPTPFAARTVSVFLGTGTVAAI
jgi:4-amino-4-deoxy-L-arabinose transferase-like glycosyltransferase